MICTPQNAHGSPLLPNERRGAEAQRRTDPLGFAFLSAPLRLCASALKKGREKRPLRVKAPEGFDRARRGAGKRRLKTCAYGPRRQCARDPEASIAAAIRSAAAA
jgi:hypothetical protein